MTAPLESAPLAQHPLATVPGAAASRNERSPVLSRLDWRQAVGGALIALGTIAILIAWWDISGTPYPGEQMPPLASGGIGGAALIAIGVLLLNSFEHVKDREALADVLIRLDEAEGRQAAVEQRILDEVARLASATDAALAAASTAGGSTTGSSSAARRAPRGPAGRASGKEA